jgi:hypothetical protein
MLALEGSLVARLACASTVRRLFLSLACCIASGAAFGGEYPLDWKRAGESAHYRSCGCADRCWVAKVKRQRSNQVIVTLRCDCTTLYYSLGRAAQEQPHALSCSAFEGDEKFERIPQELERLLRTSNH